MVFELVVDELELVVVRLLPLPRECFMCEVVCGGDVPRLKSGKKSSSWSFQSRRPIAKGFNIYEYTVLMMKELRGKGYLQKLFIMRQKQRTCGWLCTYI